MARTLGRRGGLRRAQRLSKRRRAEIARIGASARAESLRLAEVIRNNFDYVRAIERLNPPRPRLAHSTSWNTPTVKQPVSTGTDMNDPFRRAARGLRLAASELSSYP